MHRPLHQLRLGASAAAIALVLAACGATAEPGAENFYTQHAAEAARTSSAVDIAAAHLAALPARPSPAKLEALALDAHTARRTLLAAANWPISENGEEEGVSQAELEINEGAGAMLRAMSALHQYADTASRAALARYRYDLHGGRGRWNQGMMEMWHVLRKPHPPTL